jgi:hypothetical protein
MRACARATIHSLGRALPDVSLCLGEARSSTTRAALRPLTRTLNPHPGASMGKRGITVNAMGSGWLQAHRCGRMTIGTARRFDCL